LTPKFLTLFDIARQFSCPPHLTNVDVFFLKHGVYASSAAILLLGIR